MRRNGRCKSRKLGRRHHLREDVVKEDDGCSRLADVSGQLQRERPKKTKTLEHLIQNQKPLLFCSFTYVVHVEGHLLGDQVERTLERTSATIAPHYHHRQLSSPLSSAAAFGGDIGGKRWAQVPEEPGGHQGGRRQYQVEGPQEEEEEEDHRLDENVREDDADEAAAGRLQAAVAAEAKVGRHALDQSGGGESCRRKKVRREKLRF